jgi:hypothetical protein
VPVTPGPLFGSAAIVAASGLPKSQVMFVCAAPVVAAVKPTGSP